MVRPISSDRRKCINLFKTEHDVPVNPTHHVRDNMVVSYKGKFGNDITGRTRSFLRSLFFALVSNRFYPEVGGGNKLVFKPVNWLSIMKLLR